MQKKNTVYDYVIVGSGLTALLIAKNLNRITSNILILESADVAGGANKSIQTPIGTQENGLRFFPDQDLSQKTLEFIRSSLNDEISFETQEVPAIHFESGQFHPFVGFGELAPPFYNEMNYFTAAARLVSNRPVHTWIQDLITGFTGEIATRSYVTKFLVEDGRATGVIVNGSKTINANNIIYTGPAKALRILLPEGAVSAKAVQKLAKNKYGTLVSLDLIHSAVVTDSQAIHVLNGTTADEFGPFVGQFLAPTEDHPERQLSQWCIMIDDDAAEDSEVLAASLKKIKKQIQRAYPNSLDNIEFERIFVSNSVSGNGDLKLSGQMTLPQVTNLWVASACMSPHANLLGALLQAEITCAALGCHPMGAQVEVTADNEAEDAMA